MHLKMTTNFYLATSQSCIANEPAHRQTFLTNLIPLNKTSPVLFCPIVQLVFHLSTQMIYLELFLQHWNDILALKLSIAKQIFTWIYWCEMNIVRDWFFSVFICIDSSSKWSFYHHVQNWYGIIFVSSFGPYFCRSVSQTVVPDKLGNRSYFILYVLTADISVPYFFQFQLRGNQILWRNSRKKIDTVL